MSYDKSKNFINLRLNPSSIQKSKEIIKFENKPSVKYNNNMIKSRNYYNNNFIRKKNTYQYDKKQKNSEIKHNKEKRNSTLIYLNSNTTTKYLNTNTTREDTIASGNSKKTKKTKKKDKNNSLSRNAEHHLLDTTNKLKDSIKVMDYFGESKSRTKGPEDEDIKFLYKIFYNCSNSNTTNLDKSKNNKNKLNLNDLRNYLIDIEKNFKNEGNILIYQSSRSSGLIIGFYFIKKLENLVARFSLIIFIFIKYGRLDQAKEIFLLMIKENKYYIDYIEKKIMEIYSTTNKNINILKDYPRMTYELIRIYSFIIKYSHFFNMMNYRNIFLGRYFEILYFIYNFFVCKGNNRMFNSETKNQLNFWFSSALHNVTYFSAFTYFPMDLPINLSNNIINMYNNTDDNILTDSEKSLIIKTLYNLGLFYYLNGKKDEALSILDKAKERIINSEKIDLIDNNMYQMNFIKKDSVNFLYPKRKRTQNNMFSDKAENKKILKKYSFSETIKNNIKNNVEKKEKMKNEKNIIEKIIKGFNKKTNDLEDIKLLINYGIKAGIINEKSKETEYRSKFRKVFRGSHINLSTTFRVKDFLIPYYYNNPLLRKIELLMGEIELDRRNYNSSFDHILKAFYILISLKINRTSGNQKEYNNELKIIDKYLTLIEKYKDEEIKIKERIDLEQNTIDFNCNMFSLNNTKSDSLLENKSTEINNELNDTKKEKLNMIIEDDSENNTFGENQEILVYGKQILDYKVLKEIEKFFIFLNSLSLFQIKILNETQPDNKKRNDIPILFPSQFKDCLSSIQRIELNNLQTMALSRFVILKDPNKWIMPNNLNIDLIEKNKLKEYNIKQEKIYENDENEHNQISEPKEQKYFKKLINSVKTNKEIREFLNANYQLVLKILKESDEEEIKNIIDFPYIIIDPVKNFKKKRKRKKHKYHYKATSSLRIKNNYDFDDFDPMANPGRLRTYTENCKKGTKFINHCFLPEKKIKGNYFENISKKIKNRNKSVFNVMNTKNESSDEQTDKSEYNESYEDFLLSPDYSSSFENKL